ncbi:beta-ribofuranosylaminobenzene 5'-phosphate synthase family protein [Haloprofundus salinisoli]|uniref:beta-ribofuranosylaminobenzene 5'-phosphate synthase family protein n=1 Tax=Haloprofundus salinisoli TaxID=2876193 RepID=UPI001CCA91D2|nr:beta-ribofuranosylaminobenzene 5'-phosphate synthase family protein [Haloprofundus salinisoli]
MTRVTAAGRLHFGFCNLSLAHERLYGALGAALDTPELVVDVTPDDAVTVDLPESVDALAETVHEYAGRATELLGVPGANVRVESSLPRHVGLGSGTQLALSVFAGVAGAYDRAPNVRKRAPALGRGGRSGVGVAAFESGGFVLDAGHPTARFTVDRPEDGAWTVPAAAAQHRIPDEWRFLVVLPDAAPGKSDADEDASMRAAVERADPAIADRISGVVVRRVLPAIGDDAPERFGEAVAEIGRLNGAWYADEQGGVYRPPVGELVASLDDVPAVYGAGQSSWGPAVYGVTDAAHADAAQEAGEAALAAAGIDGDAFVSAPRNVGARVE